MKALPAPPDDVFRLLWDVDPTNFDFEAGRELVIERVMSRGSWAAMQWLCQRYDKETLAAFVQTRGARALAPRDRAYWALVCDLEVPSSGPGEGGGRPPWAGP